MKKLIGVLFCLVAALHPLAASEQIDLVVLFDTSESMMPYFDNTVQYLLKDILKEHLTYGDSFHLISFADEPEFELSKKINEEKDIEEIVSRVLLLSPLGKYTDLVAALKYLYEYTEDLSLQSRKTILILTDGIHDPPQGSLNADGSKAREETNRIAQDIRKEGWDVNLLEYPLSGQTQAGGAGSGDNLLPTLAGDLKVPIVSYPDGEGADSDGLAHSALGAPEIIFPGHLGKVKAGFAVPLRVKNYRENPVLVKLNQILMEGQNILNKPVSVKVPGNSEAELPAQVVLPKGMELGEKSYAVELVFDETVRVFPRKGVLAFTYVRPGLGIDVSVTLRIVLLVLCILLGVGLLFLLFRSLFTQAKPQRRPAVQKMPLPERERQVSRGQVQASSPLRRASLSSELSPAKSSFSETAAKSQSGMSGAKGFASASSAPYGTARGGTDYTDLSASLRSEAERQKYELKSDRRREPAVLPVSKGEREIPKSGRGSATPVELKVSYKILHRKYTNIHWFSDGTKRTIGGAGCSYFIDLPSVTGSIAEISFEHGSFILTPTRPEFFPDLSGPVRDCLKKRIRLYPSIEEETVITFVEYVSPVDKINRIMHLTDRPGNPNFDY
jgi:hypothetical protein